MLHRYQLFPHKVIKSYTALGSQAPAHGTDPIKTKIIMDLVAYMKYISYLYSTRLVGNLEIICIHLPTTYVTHHQIVAIVA